MKDLYDTRGGREFVDRTVPELVRQLGRLNEMLEQLVRAIERRSQP